MGTEIEKAAVSSVVLAVVQSMAECLETLYLKDSHSTTESDIPMFVQW